MPRISENDLVLPVLDLLSKEDTNTLSTTDLIRKTTEKMKPTGSDLDILKNRKDTKFSQKVRNLKSHNKISKLGYAKYIPPSSKGESGKFTLTDKGMEHLTKYNKEN
ncbi:hypothetical protein [Aliarcobacter skirrowii]|jgi:hypothetical protein|uniref:hypothetical protein n=1 Tax=Aliarcobacter skirrowii TaxID=28200 RepID=UPI00082B0E49|nr:hypothetical protein [Aliarcobacter skirrowii]